LRPHVVFAERDGLLTAQRALQGSANPIDVWVYMCGPPGMMAALADGFRLVGIAANHIRWEEFGLR
jgi:predicted ferric reductase